MNPKERESFVKSLVLFFISIEILLAVITFLYYQQEVTTQENALFLEMKNVNYTLEGDKFTFDFITPVTNKSTYTLYHEATELCSFFPIPTVKDTWLKISLSTDRFNQLLQTTQKRILVLFLVFSGIALILALLFASYTLKPLRLSFQQMEEFLKDIIHDLNTPVTTLMLNAQLIEHKFTPTRAKRMQLSANTIAALHKNLLSFLNQTPLSFETIDVAPLIVDRVNYFSATYENLTLHKQIDPSLINTNRDAFVRILDNILSNACKYNTKNGNVYITLKQKVLTVRDEGHGIKDTKKIFTRYYKEHDRGLGIGLHIVQKLCDELHIQIEVISHTVGTSFVLTLP